MATKQPPSPAPAPVIKLADVAKRRTSEQTRAAGAEPRNGQLLPSPAEQPSLAEILPFLPGRPPQQVAEILARIATCLPHGCTPQVLAAVVIDYLPHIPDALNRTLPPPNMVWPDTVLAELEDFLLPEEAEYRRAARSASGCSGSVAAACPNAASSNAITASSANGIATAATSCSASPV
jgi:hypothetical protein